MTLPARVNIFLEWCFCLVSMSLLLGCTLETFQERPSTGGKIPKDVALKVYFVPPQPGATFSICDTQNFCRNGVSEELITVSLTPIHLLIKLKGFAQKDRFLTPHLGENRVVIKLQPDIPMQPETPKQPPTDPEHKTQSMIEPIKPCPQPNPLPQKKDYLPPVLPGIQPRPVRIPFKVSSIPPGVNFTFKQDPPPTPMTEPTTNPPTFSARPGQKFDLIFSEQNFSCTGSISINRSIRGWNFYVKFPQQKQSIPENFILLPERTVTLGRPGSDPSAEFSEMPERKAKIGSFIIGKYEVRVDEYESCVNDHRACPIPSEQNIENFQIQKCNWLSKEKRPNHPINCITHREAQLYAAWYGRTHRMNCQLPDEDRWERAARSEDGSIYPWGEKQLDPPPVNYCDQSCIVEPNDDELSDHYKFTAPVGSFQAGNSPDGVSDLLGNVAEWTGTDFDQEWHSNQNKKKSTSLSGTKTVRGGGFEDSIRKITATHRSGFPPDARMPNIGFRISCDLPPISTQCEIQSKEDL